MIDSVKSTYLLPIKEKNLTPEDIPSFESDFLFFLKTYFTSS
jgi:hypothetical protein